VVQLAVPPQGTGRPKRTKPAVHGRRPNMAASPLDEPSVEMAASTSECQKRLSAWSAASAAEVWGAVAETAGPAPACLQLVGIAANHRAYWRLALASVVLSCGCDTPVDVCADASPDVHASRWCAGEERVQLGRLGAELAVCRPLGVTLARLRNRVSATSKAIAPAAPANIKRPLKTSAVPVDHSAPRPSAIGGPSMKVSSRTVDLNANSAGRPLGSVTSDGNSARTQAASGGVDSPVAALSTTSTNGGAPGGRSQSMMSEREVSVAPQISTEV
jgi:hypothetical protein